MHGLRTEQVILAVRSPLVLAPDIQRVRVRAPIREGVRVADRRLAGNDVHADAADA